MIVQKFYIMLFDKFEVIIFDFDGVIVDSKEIRINGFKEIFKNHKSSLVDQLIKYHNANGGISRYEKIKWFYKFILKQYLSEEQLSIKSNEFKEIMLKEMVNPNLIIRNTLDFIKKVHKKIPLHIISGSDELELNFICKELNIKKYFKTIKGSPKKKSNLIKEFIDGNNYTVQKILYIGDSLIDYKCAKINNISFYGFNNPDLLEISDFYIDNFQ